MRSLHVRKRELCSPRRSIAYFRRTISLLGGSTAIMDSTSAVMMALAEAPALVGSVGNFDPTARLLIACRWPSANAVLDETSLGGARNRLESSQVARSHSVSFRLIPSHSVSFGLAPCRSAQLASWLFAARFQVRPRSAAPGIAGNRPRSPCLIRSHLVSFGLIQVHSAWRPLARSACVSSRSCILRPVPPHINNQTTRTEPACYDA